MNRSENRDHKDPEKRPSLFAARSRNLWESLLPVLILIGMILILTVGWDLFVAKESQKTGIFFKAENIGNIFRQNAHYGILAVGMTFVIITAGIDLSVGSLLAFCSVLMAWLIEFNVGPGSFLTSYSMAFKSQARFTLFVWEMGILAGLLLGLSNGFFITYMKALPGWLYRQGSSRVKRKRPPRLLMVQIQPFIVTLAMMSMARGFAFLWTKGRGVDIYGQQPNLFQWLSRDFMEMFPGLQESFKTFSASHGQGPGLERALAWLASILVYMPWSGIIFLAVVGAGYVLLSRTRFGRYVYAIGSNEPAALLSGIPVARVKILVYGLCGALCGVAATLYTSIQNAGRPDDGVGFELDAIAAVVIGGTSLMGGRGGIGGTLIGALIIGVLNNVLSLRMIDPNLQRVLKGAIIILAVLLQKQEDD